MAHTRHFQPVNELKYLFFDLNSYFASVEQNENPHLRGKPVAVVPMDTKSTCAIAASYEAKAYGVKTGTRIYEAKKLCPDLVCVLARHDLYVNYHHRIMDELENHLHVDKVCSVDEAACLLLGPERIEDNARAIALNIKKGLLDNIGPSIRCSIGIAPNIFLAKQATELQKPDGLVILRPGAFKERLFQMRLKDLTGINKGIERRLNKAGVYSVEEFWKLAPKHARKIWGSVEGERFWYKLHGYEIPDKETKKRVIGHSRVLDPKLRSPDKAYDITRELTLKAATRLRRYKLYAKKLVLSVRTTDHERWAAEQGFSPTQDNFTFLKALDHMWQTMSWDLQRRPLFKTSITIHDLYESHEVTLDLFADHNPKNEKDNKLTAAIDSLNTKYGVGAISIGASQKTSAGHVGTKIAFTRIPEKEEF